MVVNESNTDPLIVLDSLDAIAIRRQLAELDSRARALRVLLRAAIARERHRHRDEPKGVARATK